MHVVMHTPKGKRIPNVPVARLGSRWFQFIQNDGLIWFCLEAFDQTGIKYTVRVTKGDVDDLVRCSKEKPITL